MKKLTTIFVCVLVGALIFGTAVSALVINGDFETGAFGAWSKSTFINNGFSSPPGAGGADLSAIVGGPGVVPLSLSDPRSNGNLRFPAYGNYSVRVNSELSYASGGYGQNGNAITQNIPAYIDPSDGKAHIKFTYAAVMVNPGSGHTPEQKPYFRVRAINTSNGNAVLYDFQSYVSEPGKNWQNGAAFGGEFWQYLDWTLIDLTPTPGNPVNAGDIVQVIVSAAGCSPSGHPGYVYVDEITDNEVAGPTVSATGPATTGTGSTLSYTYNYRNGAGSAISPTVSSTEPAGVTFTSVSDNANCSLSSGTVTCNFTNVPAGGTGSFTINGAVTAANGSQIAHGAYQIAATGFPTLGGQTVLTDVTSAATTTTVSSSAAPSVFGQNVVFTANVTSGSGTPTGTVQFVIDGANFGSPVTLSGGSAQINTSGLTVAGHTVQAIYSGGPGYSGSNGSLSGGQTVNKANTAVTVSSSPNPAVSGQGFTITANVVAVGPGSGTPTGTVTFYVDGNPVCTGVVLTSGQATCNTSGLPAGNHVITVTYGGDPNFNGGSGTQTGGQVVNKADTTVGVTASPNPSVYGQPVTYIATVGVVSPGSGTPTGTITFFADGNAVCSNVAMSGVQATCSLSSLTAGSYVITATYNGDPNFNTSNGLLAGGMTVNKADTTLDLASSVNPSVTGQSVTFTATVAAVSPGAGTPTGTVTFSVDGSAVCTNAAMSAGVATCTSSAFNAGNHPVAATYGGDSNFGASNGSLAGGQNVNKADTSLALAASVNPSVFGQTVTFTADVSVNAPGSGTPTGTVTFFADGNPICSNAALAGTQATCSTLGLSVGSHGITATYGGDVNFNGSGATLAGGFGVNKANTTTTVVSSLNPAVFGEPVTFTASVAPVAPGSGTPSGTVSFNIDGNILCANVVLATATGTCTLALPYSGTNIVVVAVYHGDSNFNQSAGSLTGGPLVITKANSTTQITNGAALGSPSHVGESYPVNWSVFVVAPGAGTPTGTVTVSDGSATCSSAVANGTCNLTSTTPGVKTITAVYSGDSNINGSSAAPAQHTVNVMISGRVQQFVAGGPNTNMQGVTVTLSGSASGTTTTDSNGVFTFSNLTGGGNYLLTPSNAVKTFDPLSRRYSGVNNNVTNADFVGFDFGNGPRDLKIVNQYVTPGDNVILPLVLENRGNETSLGFSLNYDPSPLKRDAIACGADAPGCSLDFDEPTPGRLGITVTLATPLASGAREIVTVKFRTHPTITDSNSLITFGDDPTVKATADASLNPLATGYSDGAVVFALGLESDVGGRHTGDGELMSNDVTLVRQMVVTNITADPMYNEFQRADAAPAGTKGDGLLDATDIVQARRFTVGLDSGVTPGGPYRPAAPPSAPARAVSTTRSMRIASTTASSGGEVTLPVELVGLGDEVASSFTLNFDPMKLGNPRVSLANGLSSEVSLTTKTDEPGRVTVLVDSANALTYAKGASQFVVVTFDVSAKAASGDTLVAFGSDPTPSAISDERGNKLEAVYTDGKITISGPNADGVEVSGRVLTADGRGLRNAEVWLVDANGTTRKVTTSSFGYYRFDGVLVGERFTLAVWSRSFRFENRSITVSGDMSEVDLVGRK